MFKLLIENPLESVNKSLRMLLFTLSRGFLAFKDVQANIWQKTFQLGHLFAQIGQDPTV